METSSAPAPPPASASATAATARVSAAWARMRAGSPVYAFLLADVAIVAASEPGVRSEEHEGRTGSRRSSSGNSGGGGRVTAELRVAPVHLNSSRVLHGSVSATIVDWAGGLAVAANGLPGRQEEGGTGAGTGTGTGVSTDIHVTYVSAAREGDVLVIEAEAHRVGRTLAFTTVTIRKKGHGEGDGDGGQLVCTATHTKCVRQ